MHPHHSNVQQKIDKGSKLKEEMYEKMEYNNLSFARCICTYRTEVV
jgi:hypothetical protein